MTIIYEPPWICRSHNFYTQDKAAFMKHLHDFPHDQQGNNGVCEKCGAHIGYFKIPFQGFNEPYILLCSTCEKVPNSYEYVRAKRRAEFPPDKTVKSF